MAKFDLIKAVADAKSGATIHLPVGTINLREPLRLDKPLKLVGKGKKTVLHGQLLLGAKAVELRKLRVKHGGKPDSVITVQSGAARLVDCVVSGAFMKKKGYSGVAILAENSATLVCSQCEVHDSDVGFAVVDKATLRLDACRAFDNRQNGIMAVGSAKLVARKSTSKDNGWHGFIIVGKASAELNGNICEANGRCGIDLGDGATATAKSNQLLSNGWQGAYWQGGGSLVKNQCKGNKLNGLYFDGKAMPLVRDNDIGENGKNGIVVDGKARPQLSKNHCHNNALDGILVEGAAMPELIDNHCVENELSGIAVEGKAKPLLRKNRCLNNEMQGIAITEASAPRVEGNHCHENDFSGILVKGKSKPIVVANQTRGNGKHGICVREDGAAKLEGNKCTSNVQCGLFIDWTAKRTTVTNNTCSGNAIDDLDGAEHDALCRYFGLKTNAPLMRLLRTWRADRGEIYGWHFTDEGQDEHWGAAEKQAWFQKHFRPFARDGAGGSIAFWLRDGDLRAIARDTAPIVFLEGEGETEVLANNFAEYLTLLASKKHWDDAVDDIDCEALREVLIDRLSIEPATAPSRLGKRAEKNHPGLQTFLRAAHVDATTGTKAKAGTKTKARTKTKSLQRFVLPTVSLGEPRKAGAVPARPTKILKRELAIPQMVSVEVAPLEKLPTGLPASWRKALSSSDPVARIIEEVWHPWRDRLPYTVSALEQTLQGIALLQTKNTAASLIYIFGTGKNRCFLVGRRGQPAKRLRASKLAKKLPASFLDLYQLHDGWPEATHGTGLVPFDEIDDLTYLYDEGERDEVTPGVATEDYLVVWTNGAYSFGFDVSGKQARGLESHPREAAEVVTDPVAYIDRHAALELLEY